MGPIKPLHSLAKHKGGEKKAAERRRGLCVCVCERVRVCPCTSVCRMLGPRAPDCPQLSEWQRGDDIYKLRTNECNLCVGNELIQLA